MTPRAHRLPPIAGRLIAALLVAAALLATSAPRHAAANAAPPEGMIVLLQIRTARSDLTCTGFMVGPHTVATAAHCLYNPEFGGWATSAYLTPGIDGIDAPLGTVFSTAFAVAPGWLEGQPPAADYGAITLSSDALGEATGWFDLWPAPDLYLTSARFSTAGYGSSVLNGTVWRMERPLPFSEIGRQFLYYQWGTSTGESGAPLFDRAADGRYRALGLVKGAFVTGGSKIEFAMRVTDEVRAFYAEQRARPVATAPASTVPTMFTTDPGTAVRVTSPATRPNAASVLQSSADQVRWTTIASATTDASGVAAYTVRPQESRYYRLVVLGVGTGRVGRGLVSGSALPEAAAPGASAFAAPPAYSASRLALVIYRGGSVGELDTALNAARARAAWVQDERGAWQLYIVGGGSVNDPFRAAFPQGFGGATAMMLVG